MDDILRKQRIAAKVISVPVAGGGEHRACRALAEIDTMIKRVG
jgi:hypothetical protein